MTTVDLGSSVHRRLLVMAAIVVLLLATPFVLGSFQTGLFTDILILTLFGISFNLLYGYTGLLSFGHAAYFGGGAYMLALLLAGNIPYVPAVDFYLLAFLLAVVSTVVLAVVLGFICVQRRELFFAMLTLAFSMMLLEAANELGSITGGSDGVVIPARTPIDFGVLSFGILDTTMYYYYTLALVLVCVVIMWRIVRSPFGEILVMIRENPERAEFVGINVTRFQWASFVISGLFTGIAGALAAPRVFVVSPGKFHWIISSEPILVSLIGGPTTFLGPAIGAVIFIALEQVLSGITDYWQIALGAILIPLVLYAPKGFLGTLLEWERDL